MGSTPSKISASRGSAVLGLSEYKTQVEVWLEIMEEMHPGFCEAKGYIKPEFDEEAAPLRWGLKFEDSVARLAEEQSNGYLIVDREDLHVGFEYDYVTCHIDGRYNCAYPTLHEGKTSNLRSFRNTYGEPGTNRVPTYIQVQVQHQMYCAGADENLVSVLVFPKMQAELDECCELEKINTDKWADVLREMGMFHQFPVERNEESIKAMLHHYDMFWRKNVLEATEPDPVDYCDIRRLFSAPVGTVVADEHMERYSAEYKDIGGEQKSLADRKEELKTMIIKYAKERGEEAGLIIDDDSTERLIVVSRSGKKMHSYNGKMFR